MHVMFNLICLTSNFPLAECIVYLGALMRVLTIVVFVFCLGIMGFPFDCLVSTSLEQIFPGEVQNISSSFGAGGGNSRDLQH